MNIGLKYFQSDLLSAVFLIFFVGPRTFAYWSETIQMYSSKVQKEFFNRLQSESAFTDAYRRETI